LRRNSGSDASRTDLYQFDKIDVFCTKTTGRPTIIRRPHWGAYNEMTLSIPFPMGFAKPFRHSDGWSSRKTQIDSHGLTARVQGVLRYGPIMTLGLLLAGCGGGGKQFLNLGGGQVAAVLHRFVSR
jgi:hypothetical protein